MRSKRALAAFTLSMAHHSNFAHLCKLLVCFSSKSEKERAKFHFKKALTKSWSLLFCHGYFNCAKDCNQVKNGKYLHYKITWFRYQISFHDRPEQCRRKQLWKASQRRISTIQMSTNMSGNLSLLTVLFIMCYFIKKGENYDVTTITRAHFDYFTDVCQNCYEYGATRVQQGNCKCEEKLSTAGGSVFLRDQSKLNCKDHKELMGKWMFLCYNM